MWCGAFNSAVHISLLCESHLPATDASFTQPLAEKSALLISFLLTITMYSVLQSPMSHDMKHSYLARLPPLATKSTKSPATSCSWPT